MNRNIKIAVTLFIILMITCGCTNRNTPVEKLSFQMGTIISMKAYGENAQKAEAQITDMIKEIEDTMSVNITSSAISQLNMQSGSSKSIKLNDDILYVLQTAKKYSELSDGALDVTIYPLVKEWGITTDNPKVPSEDTIKRLLKLVDFKQLSINKVDKSVELPLRGSMVDLGAIAKGYTADEGIRIFKENGIKSAFINLGGNVSVLGSKPDGTSWEVGIQNPRGADGEYIGILKLKDKTVVTSGDYEKFFEKDGVRYHHILDPKTGYPGNSDLISSTIVTEKSIEADALSTATFVLGLEKSKVLLKKLNGVEAIFITKDKKIHITEGLKQYFELKDESGAYKYDEEG